MTWGIPTDVFLQIHINVSLPPCASKRHFAKRPMAVARLGGRTQRTASFAVWPNEPSQPDATGSSFAGLAERTQRADRSPFVRSTRTPAPVCPGKPDRAHRHDLGQTNPRYQTRRRHEPDRGDQATKAATRACGIMAKRTGEAAHVRLGGNGRLGRTNPEAAARTKPVPSPSGFNPPTRLLVENSPFLQGRVFLRSLRLCPFSVSKDQSVAKAVDWKRSRGSAVTLPPSCFGLTIPRGSPVTPVAKRTRGAPSRNFGQTNPSGRPVRVFAKRTRGRPSRSSFRKRTQGAAQSRFGLNERTPMHLRAPSS
jgi:hypothetical protein